MDPIESVSYSLLTPPVDGYFPPIDGYPTCIPDAVAALAACERICNRGVKLWAGTPRNSGMGRCAALSANASATCSATMALLARSGTLTVSVQWLQLRACVSACVACAMECESYLNGHLHCRACAAACRRCEVACRTLMGRL